MTNKILNKLDIIGEYVILILFAVILIIMVSHITTL